MLSVHPHPPTSHFPLPTFRAALTLAEVLIAMGLMTLGLLGVAAVFPVGGFYMQSGDIADRGGAIAQAALEDAIVRGHLDPKNWIVHDFNGTNCAFMKLMSGAAPTPQNANIKRLGLSQALAATALPATLLGQARPTPATMRASLFGGAFVIDPIGMATALANPLPGNAIVANPGFSAALQRFPAFGGLAPANGLWSSWVVNGGFWPVRRVTVHDAIPWMNSSNSAANNEFQRPLTASQNLFTSSDDLALTLPESGDEPAQTLWDTAGVASARRTARGDYSWLISVTPDVTNNQDRFAADLTTYPVEVSAVVFHKRVTGRGPEATLAAERLVDASVVNSGPGGGELLLQRRAPGTAPPTGDLGRYTNEPATSPFENLKVGQFIMLTGPHPISTNERPMLVLHWYRVLSIEEQNANSRLVSLRGPDWPWQPSTNTSNISNNLRVGILPGVVAVHTKTMRLESATEWSIK